MAGHQGGDPRRESVLGLARRVGARIAALVISQQVGPGPGQPPHVVLTDARAQVEQEGGDRPGARLHARLDDRLELIVAVGDAGKHRSDENAALDPRLVETGHGLDPPHRVRRSRPGRPRDIVVEGADGEVWFGRCLGGPRRFLSGPSWEYPG